MKLVQIPGTQTWVNPEYVTSIHGWKPDLPLNTGMENYHSEIEYEGNAGYRTRSTISTATPAELAALVNDEQDTALHEKLQQLTSTLELNNAQLVKFLHKGKLS